MNLIKLFSFIGSLALSISALAEGGGDKVFNQMMRANEAAMQKYAEKAGKSAPPLKEYQYGMALDVVKVVNVTPPITSCGVVPARMTYEDSRGQLTTLQYSVAGECRRRGG